MIKELATGQTGNKHILEGKFKEVSVNDTKMIKIQENSYLKHVDVKGNFAEHNTLIIEPGNWVVDFQVEYNPFQMLVSYIWD